MFRCAYTTRGPRSWHRRAGIEEPAWNSGQAHRSGGADVPSELILQDCAGSHAARADGGDGLHRAILDFPDRRRRPAHTAGCGLSRSYVVICSGVQSADRGSCSSLRPAATPAVSRRRNGPTRRARLRCRVSAAAGFGRAAARPSVVPCRLGCRVRPSVRSAVGVVWDVPRGILRRRSVITFPGCLLLRRRSGLAVALCGPAGGARPARRAGSGRGGRAPPARCGRRAARSSCAGSTCESIQSTCVSPRISSCLYVTSGN